MEEHGGTYNKDLLFTPLGIEILVLSLLRNSLWKVKDWFNAFFFHVLFNVIVLPSINFHKKLDLCLAH